MVHEIINRNRGVKYTRNKRELLKYTQEAELDYYAEVFSKATDTNSTLVRNLEGMGYKVYHN